MISAALTQLEKLCLDEGLTVRMMPVNEYPRGCLDCFTFTIEAQEGFIEIKPVNSCIAIWGDLRLRISLSDILETGIDTITRVSLSKLMGTTGFSTLPYVHHWRRNAKPESKYYRDTVFVTEHQWLPGASQF